MSDSNGGMYGGTCGVIVILLWMLVFGITSIVWGPIYLVVKSFQRLKKWYANRRKPVYLQEIVLEDYQFYK
jgi:hypothetical protein